MTQTGRPSILRRTVQFHDLDPIASHDSSPLEPTEEFHDAAQDPPSAVLDGESTVLVNAARSSSTLAPHDIRRLLSRSLQNNSSRQVNTLMTYRVSLQHVSPVDSLLDRGANGGVAGCDVRVIHKDFPHRRVNIQGIDNHQMTDLELGTVGGVVRTQHGPVIAVFNQYALYGKGPTIHAYGQLEHFKNVVDDKSIHVGGRQCIATLDGYVIPLQVQQGLARLPICPFTDDEWRSLPHVIMTSFLDWDPSVLDHANDQDDWFDRVSDTLDLEDPRPLFDEFGDYHRGDSMDIEDRFVFAHVTLPPIFPALDEIIELRHEPYGNEPAAFQAIARHFEVYNNEFVAQGHVDDDDVTGPPVKALPVTPRTIQRQDPDLGRLRPYFGWISNDLIKKTLENTTQYARLPLPGSTLLKRAFKSSNQAHNVHRHSEAVACDIVYANTPAIDNGSKSAVIFVGYDTMVTNVYGIKTDSQFIRTLEDNIRERGAPTRLLSDRAQVLISNAVQDVLRTLGLGIWKLGYGTWNMEKGT
ncbi:hypothetical protein FisN_14Hu395 [Fistulifera solaris]|uniref:Uncharacterized protein n=1 Tax=Fistulifera solaris TaxID=1519565 RepID=A0A1Z5K4S8_FISSO|nr:hypothetical protein FisN_14Hu395 [Fistulifera solaris]|eukprot:GAX21182.1 hypothetical protein FisN_14Hu395 [Fistulifera solaris]